MTNVEFSPAEFEDIRPFHDEEVAPTLRRLCKNKDFITILTKAYFPRMPSFLHPLFFPFVQQKITAFVRGITNVADQQKIVAHFVQKMLEKTTTSFEVFGVDALLANECYTFISNHSDIVVDPTLCNYALYRAKRATVECAFGDNLMQKEFATDLMRLNRGFIVKRSFKSQSSKFAALKTLSSYINYTLHQKKRSIWIAQRNGRSKDGILKTDPSVLSMFCLFDRNIPADTILNAHNVVPLSISYEWDPCDVLKAKERWSIRASGSYKKSPGEDIQSITQGIQGNKGRVCCVFGTPQTFLPHENFEAFAHMLDSQIIKNMHIFPSHLYAYEYLCKYTQRPNQLPLLDHEYDREDMFCAKQEFSERVAFLQEDLIPYVFQLYANIVIAKLKHMFPTKDFQYWTY